METNAVNLSLVWGCDPLRIEVKQCESPLREHPERRAVSGYPEPSEEDELTRSGGGRQLTCEEILAHPRRAAIFAVVEVLRGGGALEVLDGQALAQDVRLQVGTRAELPATNTQTHTRFVPGSDGWFRASSTWSSRIAQLQEKTKLQFCEFVVWTLCGVFYFLFFFFFLQ